MEANTPNHPRKVQMKLLKTLFVTLCVASLLSLNALAEQGACCAKATKDGKTCDHKCCVAAAKDGKECEKCGGKGELAGTPGACCKKARTDGKECSHECCTKAAKDGKECEKCGGKGKIAKKAEKAK
jgi:hypothetical protein